MSTFRVDVKELTLDETINSRGGSSEALISRYTETLQSDDNKEFTPILIQQVSGFNGRDKATIVIDGVHRCNAYMATGRTTIPATEWRPGEVLDYSAWQMAMLLESAALNSVHGEPIGTKQKTAVARRIAESSPKETITQEEMARKLGVGRSTISGWIADIRQRQNGNRDAVIHKLLRLGWTQQAVADRVGVAQGRISGIINSVNFDEIDNLLRQGRDMPYIAQHYQIPLPLAWGVHLAEHTDIERFKALGWGLRTWDLWNFNDCDERFGDPWPGRIPAQLVAHTLYFFTNPGDLVFDPMAGGGVTPDTCLAFGRKCRSFDVNMRDYRPEIQKHAWTLDDMRWPDAPKADLIFFDPPYFSKMERDYSDKAAGEVTPISSLSRSDYLEFFVRFFRLAKQNTKPTARIAFLNADWRDFQLKAALDESPENDITIFDYHQALTDAGWVVTHRIECPLSTERMGGNTVLAMQSNRTLGIVSRTLLVAKKGG